MKYALVKNGQILETRGLDPAEVSDQSLLHPGKPRLLPLHTEDPECDPVVEVRTGPEIVIEADRVREVYTVRAIDTDELTALRAQRVGEIKAEAQRRILEIMPDHQQKNWLAKGLEMTMTHGPDPTGWPSEQAAAALAVLPKWQAIEGIRARSNQLESQLAALSTARQVGDFDPTEGWS